VGKNLLQKYTPENYLVNCFNDQAARLPVVQDRCVPGLKMGWMDAGAKNDSLGKLWSGSGFIRGAIHFVLLGLLADIAVKFNHY